MTKKETLDAAARGEGCLGRSQDDEPVFVLVARDKMAADVVVKWASDAMRFGGLKANDPKIVSAMELAAEMDAWREAHGGGKVPD